MSAKAILIAVSVLVLLAASALAAINLSQPGNANQQTTALAPTPSATGGTGATIPLTSAVASDVDTITVYPGATHVVYLLHQGDEYGWSIQGNYVASATNEVLLQFYDDHYLKAGWALDGSDGSSGDPTQSHNYLWTDRTKTAPWDLALSVMVDKQRPQTGPVTLVEVTLSRQPNLTRVPIYPNARQVESRWESSSMVQGFGKTYFTYLTDASPDDVKAYYLISLPQAGWLRFSDATDDIATGGIKYEWHTSGAGTKVDFQRNSYIAVKASPDPTGKTEVQIVSASQVRTGQFGNPGPPDLNDYTP